MKKKILCHVVPALDVGGVEIAISRSYGLLNESIEYRVYYVRRHGLLQSNQQPVWRLIVDIVCFGFRPDFVLTSLWWSHPFGQLCKAFGISWIGFFHSQGFSHIFEKIVVGWAWRNAMFRFVDSVATHRAFNGIRRNKAFVIPYVFPVEIAKNVSWENKDFDFVWVGRPVPTKRIDLLVYFLQKAEILWRNAKVIIVLGPGKIPTVLAEYVNISKFQITIIQNESNDKVLQILSKSRFYLLFSDHEGMSMSTIEAVQAGCLPIVRPVGEIPAYLSEQSCVWVADESHDGLLHSARAAFSLSKDFDSRNSVLGEAAMSVGKLKQYVPSINAAIHAMASERSAHRD